jgi:hypothetical protein
MWRLLRPSENSTKINEMLLYAVRAAGHIPKLRNMKTWNDRHNRAYAFWYEVTKDFTKTT